MAADELTEKAAVEIESAPQVPEPAPDSPAEPPRITTAAEWRAMQRRRYLVSLPGLPNRVKCRIPDWAELAQRGVIEPRELLAAQQDGADAFGVLLGVADRVVPYIAVEPPIVQRNGSGQTESDDVLYIDEVSPSHKIALMMWTLGRANLDAIEVDG